MILLKVTDERQTYRFDITKENEDQGPRFLSDFNHLAFQMGANVQASQASGAGRPQSSAGGGGNKGGKKQNKKKR